jgi:DNA-binding response OmpR family regulator
MPKRRVLIVEDDPNIAFDLEVIVAEALDAEVLLSRSVARAKAILAHKALLVRSIDFALLDVDVTNGKTFEIAVMLRMRQVPFVFLSAAQPEQLPDDLRDAPLIAKPYDERVLVRRIREMLPEAQPTLFPSSQRIT